MTDKGWDGMSFKLQNILRFSTGRAQTPGCKPQKHLTQEDFPLETNPARVSSSPHGQRSPGMPWWGLHPAGEGTPSSRSERSPLRVPGRSSRARGRSAAASPHLVAMGGQRDLVRPINAEGSMNGCPSPGIFSVQMLQAAIHLPPLGAERGSISSQYFRGCLCSQTDESLLGIIAPGTTGMGLRGVLGALLVPVKVPRFKWK